jgi:hypothetical protein
VSRRGWRCFGLPNPTLTLTPITIDISMSFVNGHVQSSITVLTMVSRASTTLSTL